ncbi:hypothetical protein MWU58_09535 [Flavobacteriaceae bacterium S0825]|uniref:hypothetical protein n=1 Tax=Gaetbulibacter sp. S0825 TaxID=2720084 RepID=UPI001430F23A|nr:hypothetical protein [Gaetbulibacter sp. S0825]MCK0109535.1 hypothetical protein [Flavobacteriaceae bacterium S0825]NIX65168.1 hypothetical protein [Gaetbulibacter sp. S0825]
MSRIQESKQETELIQIINSEQTEKHFYPENRNKNVIKTLSDMKFFINYLEDIYNHKDLKYSSTRIIDFLNQSVVNLKNLNS